MKSAALLALLPVALLAQTPPPTPGPEIPAPSAPANVGPVKLSTASWLGGPGDDEIVGASIGKDGTITLAENGVDIKAAGLTPSILGKASSAVAAPPDPKKAKAKGPSAAAGSTGFVVRLSPDGTKVTGLAQFPPDAVTIERLRGDGQGNLYLLGNARLPLEIAGTTGSGPFVVALSPDGKQAKWAMFQPGVIDFGVDGNGDVLLLTKGHVTRYKAGGKDPIWQGDMPSHGDNRPGGMVVVPTSGISVATGYGMAKTGHEPYKDPYAYGFDRAGKPLWSLWNPDPTLEAAAQFGGNGLMADTTGMFCGSDANGKVFIGLRADGGNTITGRDPSDPSKPLDPSVFAGVFQNNAGFGFKGASMSSVLFRVDPATGKLEKGTYMTAWLTPSRANGLMIADAVGEDALQFVVGGSAAGFKVKDPWYEAPPGGYKGGGFLAVFDPQFKMVQAGYFAGSGIRTVAAGNGVVVIAGDAPEKARGGDKSVKDAPELVYGVPTFKPVQPAFGGGKKDGYFAVFKVTK